MAFQSTFPRGEQISPSLQAYLEKLESRIPSDASHVDTGTVTLAQLAARFNTLLDDLNKR